MAIETMRDSRGKIVPRRLEPIFAGGEQLRELIGELRRLQTQVLRRHGEPYMRDVDVAQVAKQIGAAASLLGLGLPASSRCRCHPQQLDCPACQGHKWTSEASMLAVRSST